MSASTERNIDYGFTDGTLSYRPTYFRGKYTEGETQTVPIVPGPTTEQLAALKAELAGDTVKIYESPDGDGAVETVLLNHEAPEANGLTIYGMGIGGNFYHPVGTRDVFALAAANPDQRLMVMNNAGSEGSSLIPREVMQEMLRTGSYQRKGEWLLHVLGRELETYGEDVAFWGNSAGGRVAMGLAASFGEKGAKAANVRVVDPLSVKQRSALGVMWGFASQAGDQGKYRASPYGGTEETDEKTANLFAALPNLFAALRALPDNGFRYPAVMGKAAGFEEDLEAAMAATRGDFSFIVPERSQFTPLQEMREAMGRAAVLQPGDRRLYSVLRHSHTIMSAEAGSRPMATLYELPKHDSQ
ncbi:hypothetical protein EYC58_00445 [Candidatus Saccharibacteria bacterium]|nr:MAG: hypothetical protein EYC58_00445 [Candidatus Saccharibacteria bacterium]